MTDADRMTDLVVMGRTGPESIRDDTRTTVCLGGYSEEYGYVRIFPTRMEMDTLERWNVVSVPVERPDKDPREESWKIAGARDEWERLPQKVRKVDRLDKPEQMALVTEQATDCAVRLNEATRSIGLVKPAEIHDVYIDDDSEDTVQMTLGMQERLSKRNYPKLYVEYTCEDCDAKDGHRQHIAEWGLYRLWDKYDDPEMAIEASKLEDPDHQCYFMIGNLRHQQTAFIIGSLIRFKKSDMLEHGFRHDKQSSLGEWS